VLPSESWLGEQAFRYRADLQPMRERLDRYRKRGGSNGTPRWESVGVGYGYVDGVAGKAGRSADQVLLGGNTGRADLGLSWKLRDGGQREAERELARARARLLEIEIDTLEQQIKVEVATLHAVAAAAAERLRLAQRKLALAKQAESMAAARVENGLAPLGSDHSFRLLSRQTRHEYVEALYRQRATVSALLVLCGLESQLGQPQTAPAGI